MERDINSSAFLSLDEATTLNFRERIESKFGEKITRCCQVNKLREAVFNCTHHYISHSSYKRFFGLVKHEGGRFSKSILDILALYLGYESFSSLQAKLNDRIIDTPIQTLITSSLERGSQIKVSFAMGLEAFMCYIGDDTFIINRSTMPLFTKGESYTTSYISAGKCLDFIDKGHEWGKAGGSAFVASVRIVM